MNEWQKRLCKEIIEFSDENELHLNEVFNFLFSFIVTNLNEFMDKKDAYKFCVFLYLEIIRQQDSERK